MYKIIQSVVILYCIAIRADTGNVINLDVVEHGQNRIDEGTAGLKLDHFRFRYNVKPLGGDNPNVNVDVEAFKTLIKKTVTSTEIVTGIIDDGNFEWKPKDLETFTHLIIYNDRPFKGLVINYVDNTGQLGMYTYFKDDEDKWYSVDVNIFYKKVLEIRNKLDPFIKGTLELELDDDIDDNNKYNLKVYKGYELKSPFDKLDIALFVPDLRSDIDHIELNFTELWKPKDNNILISALSLLLLDEPVTSTLIYLNKNGIIKKNII